MRFLAYHALLMIFPVSLPQLLSGNNSIFPKSMMKRYEIVIHIGYSDGYESGEEKW